MWMHIHDTHFPEAGPARFRETIAAFDETLATVRGEPPIQEGPSAGRLDRDILDGRAPHHVPPLDQPQLTTREDSVLHPGRARGAAIDDFVVFDHHVLARRVV